LLAAGWPIGKPRSGQLRRTLSAPAFKLRRGRAVIARPNRRPHCQVAGPGPAPPSRPGAAAAGLRDRAASFTVTIKAAIATTPKSHNATQN
jgi:hypothetical protein